MHTSCRAGVGLFPWTVPSARCCHSPGVNPTTEETDFSVTHHGRMGAGKGVWKMAVMLSLYIFLFFFYYGNVSRNTGNKCVVSKEARPAPQAHYLEVRGTARGRRNERSLGQFFPALLVRFCPPVNRARSSALPEEGPDSWVASTRHSLPSQHVARRVGRIFAAEEKVQRFGNGRRFLPTSVPPRFVFEGRPRFIKPELGSE